MASPSTLTRNRVAQILTTEFTPEGLTVLNDRLDPAVGLEAPLAAVFPIKEEEGRDALTLNITVGVQVFQHWNAEVDPYQKVDPAGIEAWAARFRAAFKANSVVNDPNCWFLRVTKIEYPPDPTGNITRFQALVTAFANNSAEI